MNPRPLPAKSAAALDELCINTLRFLSVDAVQKAEQRPSGAAAGRGADGLCALDALISNTIRRIRIGSTAIASCCRPGTARCCCTACSI